MGKYVLFFFFVLDFFFLSCTTVKETYSPQKKYDRQSLQQDYLILENILEKKHPSLYWYTPKDSMDFYFSTYYYAIPDSMTEQQFAWKILSPLVQKIECGHTSVSMSKAYSTWAARKRFPSFPLYMKVWNDTMIVMANLNKGDSVIKRGTMITTVNGLSPHELTDSIFNYLPRDGSENSINYIRMSANFPYYHRNIFGLSKTYTVDYLDISGNKKTTRIPLYVPLKDSLVKDSVIKKDKHAELFKTRLSSERSFKIDSSGKFAVMTLNSFSKGRLRTFFRRSFRKLHDKKINNLVLDIRYNGGGRVGLSTLLTKYVSRKPFRVADSIFSITRKLHPYSRYISGNFFNDIELFFITKKMKDGNYHIVHLEHKLFNPKKTNHYNGDLYVLTAGPTFSAAALFCNAIKGQDGILLAGEKTGGGWYGNDGIMIPDIVLPNTKVRVRLPLFRMVQYNHIAEKGSGIKPDIYIGTSYDALIKGYDKKMKVVVDLIKEKDAGKLYSKP